MADIRFVKFGFAAEVRNLISERRAGILENAANEHASTGISQRALVQVAHAAPTNTGALAGSQCDFDRDVFGPTLAELPCLLHPLGDGTWPLARGT